ncbi:circularly permuted type 2 ATP-grasp protein [Sulfolobaceae archaeon RB850M]
MIKVKTVNSPAFLEYTTDIYKTIINDLEENQNIFFKYVQLINELAYREGFTFYTGNYYRSIKVDPIPRLLRRDELEKIAYGLRNRADAINKFLFSYYHGDKIVVPEEIIKTSPYFRPEMIGFDPPKGIYVYIFGEDLVKVKGVPFILEDNVRIPSGMSYALKANELTNRVLGDIFSLRGSEGNGLELLKKTLSYASDTRDPVIAILTDGTLNSAYFEHKFYSDKLDLLLAEPSDIIVKDKEVVVQTLDGEVHVDVIYRRIEDLDYLTPGLMNAYLRGWVNIVNAPGTGIADDKMTFCFMPQIMEELGIKEGIRQPFSFPIGTTIDDINKLKNMVIKKREGYGGSGTFVLTDLPEDERIRIINEVLKSPEEFMAQEVLDFDTVISAIGDSFYQTYADLRFFVFINETSSSILSRVAPIGSRVTNNSSGGLVKPVWIV